MFFIAILTVFNLICLPISTWRATDKINIMKKQAKRLGYFPLNTKKPMTSKNFFDLKENNKYNTDIGLLFKNWSI